MKILLDTASLEEVRWATEVGIIDGVTTDPTLITEEESADEYHELLAELCRLTRGPVFAPVLAITADDIYRDGKELARIADNIVVEIQSSRMGCAPHHGSRQMAFALPRRWCSPRRRPCSPRRRVRTR